MEYFTDSELGTVYIKRNSQARKYIFRASSDGIIMTVPKYSTNENIKDAFNKTRSKLGKLITAKDKGKIRFQKDLDIEISDFRLCINESNYGNTFTVSFSNGILSVITPQNTDYSDPRVTEFINSAIEKVLKYRAKSYLPQRLKFLAEKVGARYKSCSVSYGKQRLGRCDSNKNILLSYRLMLLPPYLADYIILHELAHLKEMNHGDRFHALLDQYCGGNNKLYNKHLKAFIYPV